MFVSVCEVVFVHVYVHLHVHIYIYKLRSHITVYTKCHLSMGKEVSSIRSYYRHSYCYIKCPMVSFMQVVHSHPQYCHLSYCKMYMQFKQTDICNPSFPSMYMLSELMKSCYRKPKCYLWAFGSRGSPNNWRFEVRISFIPFLKWVGRECLEVTSWMVRRSLSKSLCGKLQPQTET